MSTGSLCLALFSIVGAGAEPLTGVRKICVDKIAGEAAVAEVARELAFAALYSAKPVTATERCDKADAILKGAVIERRDFKRRAESEGIGFGAVAGAAGSGGAAIGGVAGSQGEALSNAETKGFASVVLRLVDTEGNIIWAYSQDSPGGKNRGPLSDAVDRAMRQLLRELENARGGGAPAGTR